MDGGSEQGILLECLICVAVTPHFSFFMDANPQQHRVVFSGTECAPLRRSSVGCPQKVWEESRKDETEKRRQT